MTTPTRTQCDLSSFVKIFSETDDGLTLFNYLDNPADDQAKNTRGLVFAGQRLVAASYPYVPELCFNDAVNTGDLNGDLMLMDSYEGTTLRLFNFNGKWRLATHRKLDAFTCCWARKESFGDLFISALETTYSTNEEFRKRYESEEMGDLYNRFVAALNPNRIYVILLRATGENRVGCSEPAVGEAMLYHMATLDLVKTEEGIKRSFDFTDEIGLPHPFTTLSNGVENWRQFDESDGTLCEKQGIFVYNRTSGKFVRVFSTAYMNAVEVRGNCPLLGQRYLNLLGDDTKRTMFEKLYGSVCDTAELKLKLEALARRISLYHNNRKSRKTDVLPPMSHSLYKNVSNYLTCKTDYDVALILEQFKTFEWWRLNRALREQDGKIARQDVSKLIENACRRINWFALSNSLMTDYGGFSMRVPKNSAAVILSLFNESQVGSATLSNDVLSVVWTIYKPLYEFKAASKEEFQTLVVSLANKFRTV